MLAHEMAHVGNRDTLIMAVVASIAGAISMLAFMAQFAAIFASFGGDRDRGGGIIGLLVAAIIMPIAATLVRLAISRAREYQADATGAKTCGNPHALASALEKLEMGSEDRPMQVSESASHLLSSTPSAGRRWPASSRLTRPLKSASGACGKCAPASSLRPLSVRLLALTNNSRCRVPALSCQYPGALSWILYILDLLRPVAALTLAITVAAGLLLLVWGHTVTTVLLDNWPYQGVLAGSAPASQPAPAGFTELTNELRLWLARSQELAQVAALPLMIGSGLALVMLFAPKVLLGLQWLGGTVAITGGVTWAAATLLAAHLPSKLADLAASQTGIDQTLQPDVTSYIGETVPPVVWHLAGAASHAGAMAMLAGASLLLFSVFPSVRSRWRSIQNPRRGGRFRASGRRAAA